MMDFFFPDLTSRSNEPELMDLPDCDKKKLINTVRQFTVLNFLFTRSRALIKKFIISDALCNNKQNITFLDIGSGGCDIPLWLVRKCRQKKINIKITCIDSDKRIIEYANKRCKGINEIRIINSDAININKLGHFDYIFANHFLHHIPTDIIPHMIKKIHASTKRIFLLNDIYRSNAAYLGYSLFTGFFFHSSFSFYDGRLSIKKGFRFIELNAIIKKSGLIDSIEVKRILPARIFMIGRR